MEINSEIRILFTKYVDKDITSDELMYLYHYFQIFANEQELDQLINDYFQSTSDDSTAIVTLSEKIKNKAWDKIQNRMEMQVSSNSYRKTVYYILSIAAGILFVFFISLYFINNTDHENKRFAQLDDVLPGKDSATLISSNGTVYNLDGAKNEIVADQNSIHYKDGDTLSKIAPSEQLRLMTPRGGQYRLTLIDGTRVWLNSASSLVYPVAFTGKERRVELIGEAYFEVAHNAEQPFVVTTATQKVIVLGTSFNINAYRDENKVVTTLLTGRVQINDPADRKLQQLGPDEQAVFDHGVVYIAQVDAHLYTAWKDGEFRFKATPLHEVLRQIERWYDLKVDYSGIPSDIKIHASINRNKKLSSVLHALEKITDLKFNIQGREVKLMQ